MLMIGIYSFTVWYTSREIGFQYFGIIVVSGGFYSLAAQGLAFEFLWPESPGWATRATGVLSLVACSAGMMFVRTFLGLRTLNTRVDKIARYYTIAAAVAMLIALIVDASYANRLALLFAAGFTALVTFSRFLARRKLIRGAIFFMPAWVILMLGIVLELSQRLGLVVPPLLAYNSIQLAVLASISVLTLGLSDRLQSMMEGYRVAQEDILRGNQLKIEALQQPDRVKEEFIANVSRELRTPLTGIIGFAEIMLTDHASRLSVSQRETLTLIKVSAQRLSSLVNDVIDFSAMKNGQLTLAKRDVDLKQVCSLVARMSRPLVGYKPVKLVEKYPAQKRVVEGDPDRLQQILSNLVANAVKFTPQGIVTNSIGLLEDMVRVSVSDTGIGISTAEQKNIFKRFYQGNSDEARQVGGTGLGLSISQCLLELHDSEIELQSTPGEGSLLYFDLALKQS